MLTSRGWWLLLVVLSLLALGTLAPPHGHPSLTLLGLTLFAWIVWEWLRFGLRVAWVVRDLRVDRQVLDERGPVDALWAGRSFTVKVQLHLPNRLGLPWLLMNDRVPFGLDHLEGDPHRDGGLAPGQPLDLSYRVRCSAPGKVRFEGVSVHLADLQGLFYHTTFVPQIQVFRVLPPLADAKGHAPAVKRHNLLPPPGVHRHRRPGSGSELLDLRDYLPGDPPKMIAWKASARRDRLITKEFESDVPIRCTLFVDTSSSVRLGLPGQNALTRLVEICSAVVQAGIGRRDLVGLCLFDEAKASVVRPARGSRHLALLLNLLTDAAGLAPTSGAAPVDNLTMLAYAFAQERYPDLLKPEVNAVPWWLPWLWPVPTTRPQRSSLGSYLYAAWFATGAVLFLAAQFLLFYVFFDFDTALLPDLLPWPLLLGCLLAGMGVLYAAFFERVYHALPLILAPQRRRLAAYRKRLAALLCVHYRLPAAELGRFMEEDECYALSLQRFLAEHHVPYALPLYDPRGQYLFACPSKVEVLAGALLRAVGKGQDNELFVLLADLLELEEHMPPLLRAIQVAIARHHRVIVVCPWPPGVPLPEESGPGSSGPAVASPGASRSARPLPRVPGQHLQQALRRGTIARFHHAFHQVRQAFTRLGVPVLCARKDDSVPLILERIEQLRTLRTRR